MERGKRQIYIQKSADGGSQHVVNLILQEKLDILEAGVQLFDR